MFFVTARNEVGARLYFHRCLWFCSQGGLPQCMFGYHTPNAADPPWQGRPPLARQTNLARQTPPAQCMLGDTVNKRAVCILLECNSCLELQSSNCFWSKHVEGVERSSKYTVRAVMLCVLLFWSSFDPFDTFNMLQHTQELMVWLKSPKFQLSKILIRLKIE